MIMVSLYNHNEHMSAIIKTAIKSPLVFLFIALSQY